MSKKPSEILLLELQQMHRTQDDIATDVKLMKVKLYGENGFENSLNIRNK